MATKKKNETENTALVTTEAPVGLVRVQNMKPKGIDLPAVDGFERKTLLPGGNNVAIAHLQALANNPGVRWYFDHKWLVLQETGEGEPEGPARPQSLAGFEKAEGAIAVVEVETDVEALTRWHANETRSVVQEAIGKRLAALKAV